MMRVSMIPSKKLRIFLGLPVTPDLSDVLDTCREQNRHLTKIQWVIRENLHLTVCFIGNIRSGELPEKISLAKESLKNTPEFTLVLEKFCAAPSLRPRMVWAQFKENVHYTAIALKTHSLLIPGQPVRHNPIPHITLARFKSPSQCNSLLMNIPVADGKITSREWVLWESVKEDKGMKYIPLETFYQQDSI